jgi:hypothetical protein
VTARLVEQCNAVGFEMVAVQQIRIIEGDQFAQPSFALDQGKKAEVFAVQPQQIESVEPRCTAPEQQIAELGAALIVEADYLAVENGPPPMQGVRETGAIARLQLWISISGFESLGGSQTLCGFHAVNYLNNPTCAAAVQQDREPGLIHLLPACLGTAFSFFSVSLWARRGPRAHPPVKKADYAGSA